MNVCTDPSYTCSRFDKKSNVVGYTVTRSFEQQANRVVTLSNGSVSVDLQKRTRDYTYSDNLTMSKSGARYVVSDNTYFDCGTQTLTPSSTMQESYETTDVTFYYADLRNDLFVYVESVQKMEFGKSVNTQINARTSYDDAKLYPYIYEEVPITVTRTTICTKITTPLLVESYNSGYADEIKVLMPLFSGNADPYGTFQQNDKTYDAKVVDWYYLPTHREADGDEFFWWADWHKAVGVNTEQDADEARIMWATNYDGNSTRNISSQVSTNAFTGSVAIDTNSNIFLSGVFGKDGGLTINKLVIDGVEKEIPSETLRIKQNDGSYADEESTHDIYFPIAPL